MFEVINGGFKTSVQDCGRVGWMNIGIPRSGAFDSYSLRMGNLLVGNSSGSLPAVGDKPGEAGLEAILFGLKLKTLSETVIAVTGADVSPTLDDMPLEMWKAVRVNAGEIIKFGTPKFGSRSYLTVAGGIHVPTFLGSKSTYLEMGGAIGGLHGRPLKKGDIVATVKPKSPLGELEGREAKNTAIPRYLTEQQTSWNVSVIMGPQDYLFTDEAIEIFRKTKWEVDVNSDRAGYRYIGPILKYKPKANYLVKDTTEEPSNTACDGNVPGSIQVPGAIQPIVIGVDGPSFGCFAKIATVILTDLAKVAQSKPKEKTWFNPTSIEEASNRIEQEERLLTEDSIK